MVSYISTTNNTDYNSTNAYKTNYVTCTNTLNYYFPDYATRKRLAAIESRREFFAMLPTLMLLYVNMVYVIIRNRCYYRMHILNRMTVKSTCPPSRRSVHGGRRK